MAVVIGVIGIIVGVAGIIIGWIALTKVQALSVLFVKAHIQGLRTESAKNTAAINSLINKFAVLERNISKTDTDNDEAISKAPPQASTH